jgi:hypothetical protein
MNSARKDLMTEVEAREVEEVYNQDDLSPDKMAANE